MKRKDLILNEYFLFGLLLLILNDGFLKWEFGNFLTGKLSDLAGLFIFPMFITFLAPRLRKYSSTIVAILFIFWKSSLSSHLIEGFNSISPFKVNRVIDFTDLCCLVILPMTHYLINRKYSIHEFHRESEFMLKVSRVVVLIIAFVAFTSTSIQRRIEIPEGSIYIDKTFLLNMSNDEVLNKIRKLDYDTLVMYHLNNSDTINYYQIRDIPLSSHQFGMDTLRSMNFRLFETERGKSRFHLINITVDSSNSLQNWRLLKIMSNHYKDYIKRNFIKEIDK